MTQLTELAYNPASAELFAPFAERPWAMFLDSVDASAGKGRWDILAADPLATLVTRAGITEITDGSGRYRSEADPFALLRRALGPRIEPVANLPFVGGAIGWFGYDLARRIERLPVLAADGDGLPEMAIGIFDWALLVDHAEQRSWLVSAGRDERTQARWQQLVERFSRKASRPEKASSARTAAEQSPGVSARAGAAHSVVGAASARVRAPAALRAIGALRSNLSEADYAVAFARVQAYIRAGDCYQVNLAQRFAAPAAGNPWAAYQRLRQLNPAPFSAYLSTPFGNVLSSSPERFLLLRDGKVETRPIKGTRPRGSNPAEDSVLRLELIKSPKDRAENVMIVDLLRNDLGRVCRPGSIQVPDLFATETYASVHHLVSTITGQLRPGEDAVSLLRASFPGGSITGAPKIRAMEIIEELEPHRRGVYCGAIGYLGFDGRMDTNIAIRTIVHHAGRVHFWSGGGIVHDSERDQEYRETLDKAARLIELLEPESPA